MQNDCTIIEAWGFVAGKILISYTTKSIAGFAEGKKNTTGRSQLLVDLVVCIMKLFEHSEF